MINAVKTCMSSKLIGADSEFFFKMVVEAAQDIKAINVLIKANSKSVKKSQIIKGYALNFTIAQKMPRSITNAKNDFHDTNEKSKSPVLLDCQAHSCHLSKFVYMSMSMFSVVGKGG